MPRTFTLAGLMTCVTLVAISCGFVANFPDLVPMVLPLAVLLMPAGIVWIAMLHCSQHRVALSIVSFIGGFAGLLLFPALIFSFVHLQPTLDAFFVAFVTVAFGAALGVLFVGGALLMDEARHRRGKN